MCVLDLTHFGRNRLLYLGSVIFPSVSPEAGAGSGMDDAFIPPLSLSTQRHRHGELKNPRPISNRVDRFFCPLEGEGATLTDGEAMWRWGEGVEEPSQAHTRDPLLSRLWGALCLRIIALFICPCHPLCIEALPLHLRLARRASSSTS